MRLNFISGKFYWLILKITLGLTALVMLFTQAIWIGTVQNYKNVILYGYHVLFGNSGLESIVAAQNINPQPLMIFAFLMVIAALAISFKKKPVFFPILLLIFSVAASWLALQHYTWLGGKSPSMMLWGFYLFVALCLLNCVIIVLAVGLTRLRFHSGEFRDHMELLTMLIPGSIIMLIFAYLPMPGILLSFKTYKLHGGGIFESFFKSAWVGLNNFRYMFTTPDAWNMTKNTVLYNLVFIFVGLALSVTIAILITEISNRRTAKVYQTIYFLPYFLSWMVVTYLVYALLSYDFGVFNQILKSFNMEPIEWYSEPKYWPFIFIIANFWKYTGNGSIIYMAAIVGMDAALFEAASIDGASKFQQIRHITLPLLRTTMILLTILAVGRIFSADFGLFYLLPRSVGTLRNVSMVIDTYVFGGLTGGTANLGMTSAAALYQSAVGFVLILMSNAIVRRIDPDSSLL